MTKQQMNSANVQGTEASAKNKKNYSFENGKFFDTVAEMFEDSVKGMEAPLVSLSFDRNMIHQISHEDFGMSKIMLMTELEKRLNERFNSRDLYSFYQIGTDNFYITVGHKLTLTEAGKKYFKIA